MLVMPTVRRALAVAFAKYEVAVNESIRPRFVAERIQGLKFEEADLLRFSWHTG